MDFDLRLQRELDELKSRTSLHMDQLKLQTREFYERENHSLSEARDSAIADKDRAIAAEKETRSLYDQLLKK
jgi:progesterone-induced-blocking factor 1